MITLDLLLSDAPPTQIIPHGAAVSQEISAVFSDSREAASHGCSGLFVCIIGATVDGHLFAERAYGDGCRIFAVSRPLSLPGDAMQLVYEDTRKALALLSASFYRHPSKELLVCGITGTKGKTTTALMAHQLLNAQGIPTAYIGSNGIYMKDRQIPTKNTTPESTVLQHTMRMMCKEGIRVLVMEVSSQAIMQHRIDGIRFESVLFTNLSPDHIGPNEHPTFEAYRDEKRKLFTDYGAKNVILNADDSYAPMMLPTGGTPVITFTAHSESTAVSALPVPRFSATEIRDTAELGISMTLHLPVGDSDAVTLPLPGICNVQNLLGAIALCESVGASLPDIMETVPRLCVAGRAETIVTEDNARIVIDYAHNEASMRAMLETLKSYPHRSLTVLFGSVGGRTQNRRGTMGAVASELADFCVLTSDNPDREPPEDIMRDIQNGFTRNCPYVMIADRKEAIEYALSAMKENDILLLAGKGHERYQRINGEDLPFSERNIVLDFLANHPRTKVPV